MRWASVCGVSDAVAAANKTRTPDRRVIAFAVRLRRSMNTIAYQVPEVWRDAAAMPRVLARATMPLPEMSEVFLWSIDLASVPTRPMIASLPVHERRRDVQWTYRRDFELSLRCRGALRRMLGWHLGAVPREIEIVAQPGGKPELADNDRDLHFSVARCGTRALLALGRAPIGVDLVSIRHEFSWRVIARHWFHAREQEVLDAAAPTEQPGTFFQMWAHKEACTKAAGASMDQDSMSSFFVPVEGGVAQRPEKSWQLWHMQPLTAPAGHRASLAHQLETPSVTDRSTAFSAVLALGL